MSESALGTKLHHTWINADRTGPILLFLHEGLGSVAQWKNFPQRLCESLNLTGLLYDRRGHGQSPSLTEERDETYLERYAFEELPAFLSQLQIQRPLILIGHSDGGTIALLYASRYPQKVKAVVTEAAHIYVEEVTWLGIAPVVEEFQQGEKLYQALKRYHGNKVDETFYAWANTWHKKQLNNWNISHHLKDFSTPLLALQGKEDQYATDKHLMDIQKLGGSETEAYLLDDCKHSPHHEQPEIVLNKMIDYIRKLK